MWLQGKYIRNVLSTASQGQIYFFNTIPHVRGYSVKTMVSKAQAINHVTKFGALVLGLSLWLWLWSNTEERGSLTSSILRINNSAVLSSSSAGSKLSYTLHQSKLPTTYNPERGIGRELRRRKITPDSPFGGHFLLEASEAPSLAPRLSSRTF